MPELLFVGLVKYHLSIVHSYNFTQTNAIIELALRVGVISTWALVLFQYHPLYELIWTHYMDKNIYLLIKRIGLTLNTYV